MHVDMVCSMDAMDILEMMCMLNSTQITPHRAGSGFKTKDVCEVDRGFKFNNLRFLAFGISKDHDPSNELSLIKLYLSFKVCVTSHKTDVASLIF